MWQRQSELMGLLAATFSATTNNVFVGANRAWAQGCAVTKAQAVTVWDCNSSLTVGCKYLQHRTLMSQTVLTGRAVKDFPLHQSGMFAAGFTAGVFSRNQSRSTFCISASVTTRDKRVVAVMILRWTKKCFSWSFASVSCSCTLANPAAPRGRLNCMFGTQGCSVCFGFIFFL